jgi:hypothetical protein
MVDYLHPVVDGATQAMAVGLSFLGSYITIVFCEQFRLCTLGAYKSTFLGRRGLFIFMALALGGVGIWLMFYISLSSLKVKQKVDGTFETVEFSFYPVIIALMASLVLSFCGLYISSMDKMFGKTKQEIVEQFVSDTKKLTFAQIKAISHFRMVFIIATEELWYFAGGGFVTGSGVALSACLALYSIEMSHISFEWDIGVICGAVIFSWFASAVVFWILFRLLSVYPHMEWLRVLSAFLMAGTISCVHFITFSGMKFQSHPGYEEKGYSSVFKHSVELRESTFYIVATVVAIIYVFSLVIIAISDLRTWIYNMSNTLRQHQDLLDILRRNPEDETIISAYVSKRPMMGVCHRFSKNSENKNSSSLHPSINTQQRPQPSDHESKQSLNSVRTTRLYSLMRIPFSSKSRKYVAGTVRRPSSSSIVPCETGSEEENPPPPPQSEPSTPTTPVITIHFKSPRTKPGSEIMRQESIAEVDEKLV